MPMLKIKIALKSYKQALLTCSVPRTKSILLSPLDQLSVLNTLHSEISKSSKSEGSQERSIRNSSFNSIADSMRFLPNPVPVDGMFALIRDKPGKYRH